MRTAQKNQPCFCPKIRRHALPSQTRHAQPSPQSPDKARPIPGHSPRPSSGGAETEIAGCRLLLQACKQPKNAGDGQGPCIKKALEVPRNAMGKSDGPLAAFTPWKIPSTSSRYRIWAGEISASIWLLQKEGVRAARLAISAAQWSRRTRPPSLSLINTWACGRRRDNLPQRRNPMRRNQSEARAICAHSRDE